MSTRNTYRLRTFVAGGRIDPTTAATLVERLADMEATAEPSSRVALLLETVKRLTEAGVSHYDAFTALFCHPSPHAPYWGENGGT
jgi:hypothetical protein